MTLFRKLFITCLVLSILALAASGTVAGWVARITEERVQSEQLQAYGRELAETLRDREWGPDDLRQLQAVMNTLDRSRSACVWLLDGKGSALLTSASACQIRIPRIPASALREGLDGATVVLKRGNGPEMPGPSIIEPIFSGAEVRGLIVLVPSGTGTRSYFTAVGSRFFLLGSAVSAIVLAGVSYFISRRIARPVTDISAAVRQVATGDLSARVAWKSDDEVGRLAHSFNEMASELERLERSRKELIANVSHELKGPLARISGYLEAIHDGVGGPETRQQHLEIVRRETGRLGRLVNDLLDMSRLEAGRMILHRIPCDLSPNLVRAVEVFQSPAQSAGVDLQITVPPILPIVLVDPERVEQVLTNLLENALTHTRAGGSITVTTQADDQSLRVSVADTGEGIAPEDLDRVWERFYKADPARTIASSGSGLGLAIVKQLVELQGGRVSAESTLGAGSRFSFQFSLAKPE